MERFRLGLWALILHVFGHRPVYTQGHKDPRHHEIHDVADPLGLQVKRGLWRDDHGAHPAKGKHVLEVDAV